METTLAELLLCFLILAGFYKALTPIRQRLERWMLKWFRAGSSNGRDRPVIDITDTLKKKR